MFVSSFGWNGHRSEVVKREKWTVDATLVHLHPILVFLIELRVPKLCLVEM